MKSVEAIRTFFEAPDPDPKFAEQFPARKVTMEEFKALTMEDRKELAQLACEALGVPLES